MEGEKLSGGWGGGVVGVTSRKDLLNFFPDCIIRVHESQVFVQSLPLMLHWYLHEFCAEIASQETITVLIIFAYISLIFTHSIINSSFALFY